jgi:hypothetical protein
LNDNKPKFDKFVYTAELQKPQTAKSFVYRFKATDADSSHNSLIYYELLNHQDWFFLSRTTGRLYTRIKFDSQQQDRKIRINVKAYNPSSVHDENNVYTTCWLILKIKNDNNNRPRFSATQNTYYVHIQRSNQVASVQLSNRLTNNFYISEKHLFVAKITAHDSDLYVEPIKYKIRQAYTEDLFEVDELTGTISLNLDVHAKSYKNLKQFNVVLIAYDAYWSAFTNVAVNVIDNWSDDMDLSTLFTKIIYNCSINEDALPGTFLVFAENKTVPLRNP